MGGTQALLLIGFIATLSQGLSPRIVYLTTLLASKRVFITSAYQYAIECVSTGRPAP